MPIPILRIRDENGDMVPIPAIRGERGPVGPQGPQGEPGPGSGDMLASVYDPQNKATDIFAYTDEKIAEVELFKFPNATIIGTPTINNGQISNFSVNDYLRFPFIVDFRGQTFQIDCCFTTGPDVTNQQNIFDSDFGLAFAVSNARLLVALSSNGSTWDLGAHSGSHEILPNTTYYVRIQFNGSAYTVAYSLDSAAYTTDITINSTASLAPKPITIGVADLSTGNPKVFGGIINMNYCSLTIANKVVWTGMDDVGLATRMAVDMSNIDADGEAKVREIVKPMVPTETEKATWSGKQVAISDLDTIRSGAAAGATAVQTETDPTVPAWAKAASKPSYTAAEVGAIQNGTIAGQDIYAIYEPNSAVSADSLEHTYVLLNITGTPNATLKSILGENYAYIHTVMYANTQQKMQIAVGYVGGRMAARSSYGGAWTAWAGVYDTLHKPSPSDIGAAAASHTHTKSQITDFPTSLPASDVYTWAKAASKPSYTANEVGAVPTSRTVNGKALSSNITLTASDVGASPNVVAGSWVGTGRSNIDNANPMSLTFDRKIVSVEVVAQLTPDNRIDQRMVIESYSNYQRCYMNADTLTTSPASGVGFSRSTSSYYSSYMKGWKSSDGKTFYWCLALPNAGDTVAPMCLNERNYRYFYVAILE